MALDNADRCDLVLSQRDLFKDPLKLDTVQGDPNDLEEIQRKVYFVMVNGLRSLRTKAD
jgi:hypothetical protein